MEQKPAEQGNYKHNANLGSNGKRDTQEFNKGQLGMKY